MLVSPFRVFGRVARRGTFPSVGVLSDLATRSEFLTRPGTAVAGSATSTMPLAISSAAWFFPGGLRRSQLSVRCALSSSFAVLQSLAQHVLAGRPQPTSSSHGLSLPTALTGSEVHLRGLCLPATFRPQGLVTLSAAYALRAPAGFVSHRRRSWDSPFGASSSRKVSAAFPRRKDPRTVSPVGFSRRRSGGPAPRAAVPGL